MSINFTDFAGIFGNIHNWNHVPVCTVFVTPSPGYTFQGPSNGISGVLSNFSVMGFSLTEDVIVFPSDDSNEGIFNPSSGIISPASSVYNFTYLPNKVGSWQISTTNNKGLPNPSPINFTSNLPTTAFVETFDELSVNTFPSGWSIISGTIIGAVGPSVKSVAGTNSSPNALSTGGAEKMLFWHNSPAGTSDISIYMEGIYNTQGTSNVTSNGPFARASNPISGFGHLNGYALVTQRHNSPLSIVVYNTGVQTPLASLTTSNLTPGTNLGYLLNIQGSAIKGYVYSFNGLNAGKYLHPTLTWSNTIYNSLLAYDNTYTDAGYYGVLKDANDYTTDFFDNIAVIPDGASIIPSVTLISPENNTSLSGLFTILAVPSGIIDIIRVDFNIDGASRGSVYSSPYSLTIDSASMTNSGHTINTTVYDMFGNSYTSPSINVISNNDGVINPISMKWTMPNIHLEYDAYNGIVMDPILDYPINAYSDISNATDPNATGIIRMLRPATGVNPVQLTQYTNVGNVYYNILMDLFNFCDAIGVSRENTVLHASGSFAFTAGGKSTAPVRQWWGTFSGPERGSFTNQYSNSNGNSTAIFPNISGYSLYFAYPDPICEVDFLTLTTPASGGWSATLEYCNQVDISGYAISWNTITINSDSTNGLSRTGVIEFDPPSGWLPCKVTNSYPNVPLVGGNYNYYYVRWYVNSIGTSPSYSLATSRDYYGGGNNIYGTVPAFDFNVDANHDGYLTKTEYNNPTRNSGSTARFIYESRVPSVYGSMRYSVLPGNLTSKQWASSYCNNLIGNTEYNAIAMDNSFALPNLPLSANTLESTETYSDDYGIMLQYIYNNLPPHPTMGQRWIQPNINGSTLLSASSVISRVMAYDCEALLRPREHNWSDYENILNTLLFYRGCASPAPLGMIDIFVNTTNLDWTSPSSIYNMYAYYLMTAWPETVVTIEGAAPANAWHTRFINAETIDLGPVSGQYEIFTIGHDPANTNFFYKVFQRNYASGIVLFKPLSYSQSFGEGTYGAGLTTHQLPGNFRLLDPSGNLGAITNSVSLLNGYGSILFYA